MQRDTASCTLPNESLSPQPGRDTRRCTAKTKALHHRGTHQVRARHIVAAAYANPDTRCWRCERTLTEHPNTKTGKPPRWQAGHVVDGQVNGELRAEVDVCNTSAGATAGNQRRTTNPNRRNWWNQKART